MAFRKILKYPNSRLKKVSNPVEDFDENLVVLINDLWDTINIAGGAGLSAPQIGVQKRVVYISCGGFSGEMINPKITNQSKQVLMHEGCLSFPGTTEQILRYDNVTVEYRDKLGESYNKDFSGIAAQAIQHEIEHLDGRLLIDHFSSIKRRRIAKKVKKVRSAAEQILSPVEKKEPRRIKRNSSISQKELKKRKANRYRSRKKR